MGNKLAKPCLNDEDFDNIVAKTADIADTWDNRNTFDTWSTLDTVDNEGFADIWDTGHCRYFGYSRYCGHWPLGSGSLLVAVP